MAEMKYPFEKTLKMIDEGRITEALTILCLQRVWFYIQNNDQMLDGMK